MYNFATVVNYNDNFSYRNTIRNLFSLKTIDQHTEIDIETADENDYDEDAMNKGLDYIYMITKDEPLFIELYKKSAGQMLSEDIHIGMSILLSYSNLKEFHACLVEYKTNTSEFNRDNEKYAKIYTKV
jgi:hypothetical protein|tara:strand:- start:512 stop:895 length:384 start_codon:yes stop_codon:yes gene_type:complete